MVSTGERPPWRESHTCVPVTRGASVAHVVFGGFGEPKPETRSSTASDAAAQLSSSSSATQLCCEGAPLNDAFLVDANLRWRALRPSGPAPTPRGGHAACAVSAAEVLVFGGRDARGRYLNDVAVLELNSAAAMAAGWSGRHLDSAWGFPDPRGDPSFRGARLSSGGGGADAAEHEHEHAGEGASDSEASRGVCCFEDASRPRGREGATATHVPRAGRARGGEVFVFGGVGRADASSDTDDDGGGDPNGSSRDADAFLDDLWRYSVADARWTWCGDGRSARAAARKAAADKKDDGFGGDADARALARGPPPARGTVRTSSSRGSSSARRPPRRTGGGRPRP